MPCVWLWVASPGGGKEQFLDFWAHRKYRKMNEILHFMEHVGTYMPYRCISSGSGQFLKKVGHTKWLYISLLAKHEMPLFSLSAQPLSVKSSEEKKNKTLIADILHHYRGRIRTGR